jgi:hypothetical protein
VMPGPLDAVKKALQAYVDKDRDAIEAVIGDPSPKPPSRPSLR